MLLTLTRTHSLVRQLLPHLSLNSILLYPIPTQLQLTFSQMCKLFYIHSYNELYMFITSRMLSFSTLTLQ